MAQKGGQSVFANFTKTLTSTIKQYHYNDLKRQWIVKTYFWKMYEQYEYTRLSRVRSLMDQHMTYDKERMLKEGYEFDKQEGEEKKKPKRYLWSYIIKPVHKDYTDDK